MTTEMDSPTGVDLHPRPPAAVRIRKSVGISLMAAAGLIAMIIVYGVYERQQRQARASLVADVERKATPATSAGLQITSQIPVASGLSLRQDRQSPPALENDAETITERQPLEGQVSGRHLVAQDWPGLRSQNQSFLERPRDREPDLTAQKEQEAINAPTSIGGGGRSYGGNANLTAVNNPPPGNFAPLPGNGVAGSLPGFSLGESRAGLGGMSQTAEYNAQNGQDQKSAFIAQARNRVSDSSLHSVRTPPLTRYEIKAGWDIPATLEQCINSDQPGEIRALVRENVCDTATGRFVLIPQGSRLVGSYNSTISYGQDGVQAIWDRIIFPDGSSLNLNGMIGQDARGESGLRYAVDRHYARLVGFAVLTSLFSAGFQLSQNRPGTILATPSPGEIVAGAVGSQVSQLGAETFRRELNVQPTIKVPPGYRFNVRVNRDIVFDAPYSPFR